MEQLPPKPPVHNWAFQPKSWAVDEFLDFSATRRHAHRRTVSDPISFVEDALDDDHLRDMFSDHHVVALDHAEQDVLPKPKPEPEPESPLPPPPVSSENDAFGDPKRIKRILANRQSAQRSRVRKLHYISELERSVTSLQTEVSALSPRVAFLDHQRLLLNVDNSALKQRIAALAQDKIFKDAHQEALKREIERLRKIYEEQKMRSKEREEQE